MQDFVLSQYVPNPGQRPASEDALFCLGVNTSCEALHVLCFFFFLKQQQTHEETPLPPNKVGSNRVAGFTAWLHGDYKPRYYKPF